MPNGTITLTETETKMDNEVLTDWIDPKDEMPPNDYDFPCYIKFHDDDYETLSDGGTVHNSVPIFNIMWKRIPKEEK